MLLTSEISKLHTLISMRHLKVTIAWRVPGLSQPSSTCCCPKSCSTCKYITVCCLENIANWTLFVGPRMYHRLSAASWHSSTRGETSRLWNRWLPRVIRGHWQTFSRYLPSHLLVYHCVECWTLTRHIFFHGYSRQHFLLNFFCFYCVLLFIFKYN